MSKIKLEIGDRVRLKHNRIATGEVVAVFTYHPVVTVRWDGGIRNRNVQIKDLERTGMDRILDEL